MPALAADRWEEAGSGAVAILPLPKPATAHHGGSFYCSEQRWAFLLRTAPDACRSRRARRPGSASAATVFEADARSRRARSRSAFPARSCSPLKEATKLGIEIGTAKDAPKATFNLRSSKLVIEAIAPRCSQIDMSAFEAVTLSPTDAGSCRRDRTARRRDKTVPRVHAEGAGRRDRGRSTSHADKRLMFASLCGSTSYFGDSGCSLTGYAADGAESVWSMVYETEGVHIYTDPKQANGGWPNLVTLPVVGGTRADALGVDGRAVRAARPDHRRRGQCPGRGRHRAIGAGLRYSARPYPFGRVEPSPASCRRAVRPPASRQCHRTCRRRSSPRAKRGSRNGIVAAVRRLPMDEGDDDRHDRARNRVVEPVAPAEDLGEQDRRQRRQEGEIGDEQRHERDRKDDRTRNRRRRLVGRRSPSAPSETTCRNALAASEAQA